MMNGKFSTVEPALPLSAWLVGFVVAFSSLVRIEPAPYDLLTIALCAVFFMAGLRVPVRLGVPLFTMTLFAVANLLSIFGAMVRNVNDIIVMAVYTGTTIYLIITWLFFTCFVSQRPRTGIRAIWNGYVFATIVAAALGIGAYFRLIPGGDELVMYMDRARGPFKDPNVFGPFLVPPLLYVVADAIGWPLIPALVRFSLALILGLGIFLSFSRGGWLNLGISVCTFAYLHVLVSRSTRQVISFALKGLGIFVLTAEGSLQSPGLPRQCGTCSKCVSPCITITT